MSKENLPQTLQYRLRIFKVVDSEDMAKVYHPPRWIVGFYNET